jgi:Family of unknown function (DUF5686)/CarboxypepD_reg-like domain
LFFPEHRFVTNFNSSSSHERNLYPLTMTILSRFFIFVLIFVFNTTLQSQTIISGRIFDTESKEPLAFVAVVEPGTSNGSYSDIDGRFQISLQNQNTRLSFNYVGYATYNAFWNGENPWNVYLKRNQEITAEVVIRPGVNPAERIIRRAIENKEKNDPESDVAFTYDSYNKLYFTADVDSTIWADTTAIAAMDSSKRGTLDFFNQQYLFLVESISKRKFFPPDRSEETIIANRVSGLSTPDFAILATQMQSFSFYGESVVIFDVDYLSPLADGSINKYLFELEDSTFIGKDTVYTISFRPRKGKNFDGMKGQLYISTNGYAIQNVKAQPATGNEDTEIKIQQQYEFFYNSKWFPKQLNLFLSMKTVNFGGFPMAGIGRSYIKNLVLDAPLKRSEFTPVTLLMAPLASKQPDSLWNHYRDVPLETRELKTYHVIDSLGKAENFDKKLKLVQAITTGQLPLGKISIDLGKLMAFNSYEGYRLGMGLRTNDFLSEKFNVGAYYAYGFKDKHSKYGGDALVYINRKRDLWIKGLYSNDVKEMGGNEIEKSGQMGLIKGIYPLFVNRMDRREKFEVQLNGRMIRTISANFFANHQFIKPYDGYQYQLISSENITLTSHDFSITETGATIRYAPGEKLVRAGLKEIRLGGRFPVVLFGMTKGWNGLLEGDFDYVRLDARLDKTFKIKNAGRLSLAVIGGKMMNDAPLPLMYNARGTFAKKLTLAVAETFETMTTNEFMHSEYVAVHIRHNFLSLLFKRPKFQPELQLVHNMLWGNFSNADHHNINFKTATKGYYESGLQIDKLLRSGFSALGIGVFYRYGPYHLPDMRSNIAIKLTSSLNF